LLQAKSEIVHVMFNEHEMKQSSTYRELKAVDFALKSFSLKLGSRYLNFIQTIRTWLELLISVA